MYPPFPFESSRQLGAAVASVLLGFSAACGPEDPDPGETCVTAVIEGDGVRFNFVGYEGDEFCPSSFDAVESHIQWVADAWGTVPSPISYALFESREDPCWSCPAGAVGCALDGRLATTRVPDHHELAHAAHGTNCSSLLEEGWATIYGDSFEDEVPTGTLREAMQGIEDGGRLAGEHYPLAALFMAFLLETRGIEVVRELCTISLSDTTKLDAALLEVLGKSLDEVQAELDEYPQWRTSNLRQDQACEGADLFQPNPGPLTIELGCMAEGVEGKLGGRIENQGLIELPEAGPYTFEFAATEELEMLSIELRNCERDGMGSIYYNQMLVHPKPGEPAVVLLYDYLPGVYVLRAMVEDSQGTSPDLAVEVTVSKWP